VVVRSTVTAIGILAMGLAFGATSIQSVGLFLFWVISISAIFGLMGLIIGLWAKSFEQLNVLMVFFISPLSMVGGVFNTTAMLPGWLRWLDYANPFYYFTNGLRHAMIGYDETPQGLGIGLTLAALVVMGGVVWRLYARGYGLRE
jgi:ABC-2 type transport system permease protein